MTHTHTHVFSIRVNQHKSINHDAFYRLNKTTCSA